MSHKLTPEEELTVVEWIRANPCIYDKGDPEPRTETNGQGCSRKRQRSLGNFKLGTFKVGMLVNMAPSGAGAMPLTDRQKWILAQFEFLRSHMVAIPVRTCRLPGGGS